MAKKFLRYVTKRDDRVRDSHALLDWVVKKVDDPFWAIYYPPNGWNCRCKVEKLESDYITATNTIGLNLHKTVPDIFQFNAFIEKSVFSAKHPYFKVQQKFKELGKKNFNLSKNRKKVTKKPVKKNDKRKK